jgi:hypothetical protein
MPADADRSRFRSARSVKELRCIGSVGRHATGDLEIGDPDDVACI